MHHTHTVFDGDRLSDSANVREKADQHAHLRQILRFSDHNAVWRVAILSADISLVVLLAVHLHHTVPAYFRI